MILALADLHGRADLLEGVLRVVPEDTKFVFLGDAIDRGHRNRETIALLGELADAGRMTLLRGNHEAMVMEVDEVYERFQREQNDLRRFDAKVALENWISNGGDTVILEYGGWDSGGAPDAFGLWGLPPELLTYCARTEFTYRHAGGERGDVLCVTPRRRRPSKATAPLKTAWSGLAPRMARLRSRMGFCAASTVTRRSALRRGLDRTFSATSARNGRVTSARLTWTVWRSRFSKVRARIA